MFHEPERDIAALPGVGTAIYRRVAALTDVAVVPAAPASDALAAAGIDTSGVVRIPHGVRPLPTPSAHEVERVRMRYGLRGRVVLALGLAHPDEGADVLAAAAAGVLTALHDVTIAIAGEPSARRGLLRVLGPFDESRVAGLRRSTAWAGDRVRFCGPVADDDLPGVLGAAGVMVLPYRGITRNGIAHLCVAGAVPTVASRLRGLEATLGAGAMYVPPGQPDALAAALREVLGDPDRRARQQAAMLVRRAAWSPGAVADQIVAAAIGDRASARAVRSAAARTRPVAGASGQAPRPPSARGRPPTPSGRTSRSP
jgi:glycosyltransferase involved in cell wall biosynthesis